MASNIPFEHREIQIRSAYCSQQNIIAVNGVTLVILCFDRLLISGFQLFSIKFRR